MNPTTNVLPQPGDVIVRQEVSHIDWSAVLAGAAVATGIAFVFSTFGAGLGLSIISPYDGEGSALAAALAVGSWMLWTTISSFMVGGYIAGRMRHRSPDVSADEASVRDGIHGLTVWGVAILLGVVLLGSAVDTTVANVSEGAATIVAEAADAVPAAPADAGASVQGTATGNVAAPPVLTEEDQRRLLAVAKAYTVISAFVASVALLVAGAAAYWAAGIGGRHHNEKRTFTRFGTWS